MMKNAGNAVIRYTTPIPATFAIVIISPPPNTRLNATMVSTVRRDRWMAGSSSILTSPLAPQSASWRDRR